MFKGTPGLIAALEEEVLGRIMPNGNRNIDFSKLPGFQGVQVKMALIKQAGSPQITSSIIPQGKNAVKYYLFLKLSVLLQ